LSDSLSVSVPALSDEQIQSFHDTGYLVVRGGLNRGDIGKVTSWCEEILDAPEVSGRHWVYHEKSRTEPGRDLVSRIERIKPFHAGFANLTEALAGPVGQLLGESACLFKEKINFKMPGGDGFKAHQDSQAGWDKYADYFISVLVSIDRATEENGCLQIAGGEHLKGLYASWEPLSEETIAGMEFVPCPTEPGDLVFFDSLAPHASEPNNSADIRRIYYATYNRASAGDHMAQYYDDKHASYPPDIDREQGKKYVFKV